MRWPCCFQSLKYANVGRRRICRSCLAVQQSEIAVCSDFLFLCVCVSSSFACEFIVAVKAGRDTFFFDELKRKSRRLPLATRSLESFIGIFFTKVATGSNRTQIASIGAGRWRRIQNDRAPVHLWKSNHNTLWGFAHSLASPPDESPSSENRWLLAHIVQSAALHLPGRCGPLLRSRSVRVAARSINKSQS